MQNLRKHQRRREQQDSRAEQQVQAIENSSEPTDRPGKAHLKKFIGAIDSRTAEPGNKDEADDHDTDERPDLEHQECHVVAIHIGRRSEERGRTYRRRDKADAHGHPRDGAAAKHVFLEVLVATRHPETDKYRQQQVRRKNNPIKNSKHSRKPLVG